MSCNDVQDIHIFKIKDDYLSFYFATQWDDKFKSKKCYTYLRYIQQTSAFVLNEIYQQNQLLHRSLVIVKIFGIHSKMNHIT